MKSLRWLLLAMLLVVPFAATSHAQVAVGIGVGPAVVAAPYAYGPPVCDWGYYPYYPYSCAPYGYYGPSWFAGGVFIGAGPWYHWGWGHSHYGWGGYHGGWGSHAGYGYHGGYGYRGGYGGARPMPYGGGGNRYGGGHAFNGAGYAGGGHVGGGFAGGAHMGGGFAGGGFHGGGGGFHGGGGGFHGGGGHR